MKKFVAFHLMYNIIQTVICITATLLKYIVECLNPTLPMNNLIWIHNYSNENSVILCAHRVLGLRFKIYEGQPILN